MLCQAAYFMLLVGVWPGWMFPWLSADFTRKVLRVWSFMLGSLTAIPFMELGFKQSGVVVDITRFLNGMSWQK